MFLIMFMVIGVLIVLWMTVKSLIRIIPGKQRIIINTHPILFTSADHTTLMDDAPSIQPCQITTMEPCTGFYQCVHHSFPLYIYNEAFARIHTWPPNESLESGYCIPINKRPCNPYTSDSVIVKIGSHYNHVCVCKYPHLVTKRHLFDDCDVNVGCGGIGQLTITTSMDPFLNGVCVCPKGTVSSRDPNIGPTCRKLSYEEELNTYCSGGIVTSNECQCPPTHLRVSPTGPDFIHASFRHPLTTTICVKNPCMYSANWPSDYLPGNSILINHTCFCHPLNGSFPIYSHQSILNSKQNACQTFDRRHQGSDYASIKYGCYFYGDKTGRQCWFMYQLYKPQWILGKLGTWIQVHDPTHWFDTIFPESYLSDRIIDYLSHRDLIHSALTKTLGGSVWKEIGHDLILDNPAILSCRDQYHDYSEWGPVTQLCHYHNHMYLSPLYARENGYNGVIVENAFDILKNPTIKPVITFHRFDNQPSPRTFPSDMIKPPPPKPKPPAYEWSMPLMVF